MKTDTEQLQTLIDNAGKAITELHAFLLPLSVFPDGKYATAKAESVGGLAGLPPRFSFFMGDGLHIDTDRAESVFKTLAEYSPIQAKKEKLETLRRATALAEAELAAELQGEVVK